jgi:hypothetical protein
MYITSALQRTDMKAVGLQLALDLLHEKVSGRKYMQASAALKFSMLVAILLRNMNISFIQGFYTIQYSTQMFGKS